MPSHCRADDLAYGPWALAPKSTSFPIRSTRNVIDQYRRVLSVHQMSDFDKTAILLRLEEQERALRELMRQDQEWSMVSQAHLKAA
jgi:hypothetical protein